MDFLTCLFWGCLCLLGYVYVGYPVLARILGSVVNSHVKSAEPGQFLPSITILIAAFNEARDIVATVTNKLEQNYPTELLNIIVISDESEDGTDQLVQDIEDPRVRLIRQVPRAGKTSALNLAMPEATGEVIVFSDANSLYGPDTLQNLVAPLADPAVGYVTGQMVYKAADGALTGDGCSAYMRYENKLREYETAMGSIVGVDGGVDAMRREIYTPMRADQLPDFVQPLCVREQNYRVVYEPRALLYEDALADSSDEFRMRVRVSLRAFNALKDKAALLNPFRYGLFAWQMWSHKVLRYNAFLFLMAAFVVNLALAADGSPFWQLMGTVQVVFYVLGTLGHFNSRAADNKIIGLIYYFCIINLACATAFVKFLRGQKQATWKPRT